MPILSFPPVVAAKGGGMGAFLRDIQRLVRAGDEIKQFLRVRGASLCVADGQMNLHPVFLLHEIIGVGAVVLFRSMCSAMPAAVRKATATATSTAYLSM